MFQVVFYELRKDAKCNKASLYLQYSSLPASSKCRLRGNAFKSARVMKKGKGKGRENVAGSLGSPGGMWQVHCCTLRFSRRLNDFQRPVKKRSKLLSF